MPPLSKKSKKAEFGKIGRTVDSLTKNQKFFPEIAEKFDYVKRENKRVHRQRNK